MTLKLAKKAPVKVCKDCKLLPLSQQPSPPRPIAVLKKKGKPDRLAPGPRCFTHWIAYRDATRARNHGRRVATIYGITVEFYWKLYEFQNGMCYICERAYGKTKRLAVDHDHKCEAGHPVENACELCVRGLLCTMCNRKIVGHLRDDPAAFRRGAEYLENPPARRLMIAMAA